MHVKGLVGSFIVPALLAGVVGGCAASPDQIMAANVSTVGYQALTCQQLEAEIARVAHRVTELTGLQDSNAQRDAFSVGVAALVFWPAAFAIQGNGPAAAELSRNKGELVALEQVATEKQCQIDIVRPAPPKPRPDPRDHNPV